MMQRMASFEEPLGRMPTALTALAAASSSLKGREEWMMTRCQGAWWRTSSAQARPGMPGISRSSSTRSGGESFK